MKAKKFTGRHANRRSVIRTRIVERYTAPPGRCLSAPEIVAKLDGRPASELIIHEGKTTRPAGRASLFAVIRKSEFRELKRWANRELVPLGTASEAPDDYPHCLVVEIKGDGSSLKGRGWIVELWHTIPKMRVVS